MELQVERIVEKIIRDAQENATSIIEEAHRSAEMLLEQQRELARQKAAPEVVLILTKAEDEAEIAKITQVTEANRKANWMILSEKEKLVNNVLDEVRTRFIAFSESKNYGHFLQKIITEAGIVLGGGRLEVLLNEKDSIFPLNFNVLAKTIGEKIGTKTQLELSKEKIKTLGGAIIKRVDGKILVDNTFEARLERSEKNLRLKIAKILFK